FRYPGETFERDGDEWPFARVKPKYPRLSGNFDEWMENPDGSRRKLNARDRRQIAAAGAGEETHGGTPWCMPTAYRCKDDRKPVKYESPRGLGQRLYDVIGILHADGLKDDDCLYLIEGEKKTICANANLNLKAYGLPGVTGAHDIEATRAAMDSGTGNFVLHPKIEAHCRRNGKVATLFDSPDVGKNPNVVVAQARILRAVHKAGGQPQITFIPDDLEHGRKRGIDDFYVEKGQRARDCLYSCSAKPFDSLKSFANCENSGVVEQLP